MNLLADFDIHLVGNEVIWGSSLIAAVAAAFVYGRKCARAVRRAWWRSNALLDGFLGIEADPEMNIEAKPGVLKRLDGAETKVAELTEVVNRELTNNHGTSMKDTVEKALVTGMANQKLLSRHVTQAEQSERDLDFIYKHLGLSRGKAQQELPFDKPAQGG